MRRSVEPEDRCRPHDIGVYTPISRRRKAMVPPSNNPAGCNCLALRQAARHVTQHYDQFLTPSGLRATQYSILARLRRRGPMTINALAAELAMDRTTLGRNILPLQRDGLIAWRRGQSDRRSKELHLTDTGLARTREASAYWTKAQASFESAFGVSRASALRSLLDEVTMSDLGAS
jgi:DNA-binding MarR family transcriptional regulator